MEVKVAVTKDYTDSLQKLGSSIQKKAYDVLYKFKQNPYSSALNYEKIRDMKDSRVRTLRIDLKYRAIVRFPDEGDIFIFLYAGNHNESMAWAKNKRFDLNSVTNMFQYFDESFVEKPVWREQTEKTTEKSILDSYTEEELISVGVPKILIPGLKDIYSVRELDENIKGYVSADIFEILEFCVEGYPIHEIQDYFLMGDEGKGTTLDEAINMKANKRYVQTVTAESEIDSVLRNPIESWRIFIHPKQMVYVKGIEGHYKGSFQLKGAAGTGKTVVAMHRAKFLLENVYTESEDKVLFTMFSNKLSESVGSNLRNMCSLEDLRRIDVVNLHSWLAKYLRGHGVHFEIIKYKERVRILDQSIKIYGEELEISVKEVADEIDSVISYHGITTLEEYLRVSRKGMGRKLGKRQRETMWRIARGYFKYIYDAGKSEWWLMVKKAKALMDEHGDVDFSAIIVDECQDFGMAEYRLLRHMVAKKKDDLFMVGDIRQRIYSQPCNFERCGINIRGNRTRELKLNYRNTYEIAAYADAVLKDMEFIDFSGEIVGHIKSRCVMNGKEPVVKSFPNASQEAKYVVNELKELLSFGYQYREIAIVSREKGHLKEVKEYLSKVGIPFIEGRDMSMIGDDMVHLSTMHGVKGFEYKVAFLVGVNDKEMPRAPRMTEAITEEEKVSLIRTEKSLLYVSMTRARDMLYIISSGKMSRLVI